MYAQRRIRSFVLRAGRVTAAQERALTELWPAYGLDFRNEPMDLDVAFGHASAPGKAEHGVAFGHASAPGKALRCLEIGFGAGEVIGALAEANPHVDYLGIEVHRSGVGRLLLHASQAKLKNVRVVCHDAVEVLKGSIRDDSFDEILVFFPDPWHKKRHHKRRLIDPGFVALLADKMRSGGTLRLATDWQEYAEQMLAVCTATPKLESLSPDGTYVARPDFRPTTRFERRGARLGHGVWDLAYRKRST
jgi:tRNA (guanine-N7-)-methyltransferase